MFYAYEYFDPEGGYRLFIHGVKETFDLQYYDDIDYLHDHHRIGEIHNCDSVQDAIGRIADDEWTYKEYNA